ncbi:MAG: hypothetical protein JNL28_06375 [Planctomycetes bacterium]|nr:hypothetical protein [Planctomycetota bacterium]
MRKIVADAGVSISARGPLDESLTWIEGFAERTDPLTPVRKEATRVAALNAKKSQPD